MAALKEPPHLALNPFGSVPTYEEGDPTLVESGAIVLHLADRHVGLLPSEANARQRAIAWMFAALNTVEPPIVEREMAVMESESPGRRIACPASTNASGIDWAGCRNASARPSGSTGLLAPAT